MVKQSIFGRMAQLAKANINSLLDHAEDPQKMLDQMSVTTRTTSRRPSPP